MITLPIGPTLACSKAINSPRGRANRIGYEWIPSGRLVCLRPMLWVDGVRQVRHAPDPCDYDSLDYALARLEELERQI